jgi:hypothetical protein
VTFRTLLADYVLGGNLNNLYTLTGAVTIYRGTPGHGNLLASISRSAGTDAFGNAYVPGIVVYNGPSTVVLNAGSVFGVQSAFTQWATGDATETWVPQILSQMLAIGGGHSEEVLYIIGPACSARTDQVDIRMFASSTDGTTFTAGGQLNYFSPAAGGGELGPSVQMATWDCTGAQIAAGSVTAVKPGTGTPANPAAPETWHNIAGGIGYQSGWSDFGGGFTVGRYRLEGLGRGIVRLDGTIKGGTYGNNVLIFRLPPAYTPATNLRFVCQGDNGSSGASSYELEVDTAGGVTTQNTQNFVLPGFISLAGLTYPLD